MVSAQAAGKHRDPSLVAEPPVIQCPEACYLHFKAYSGQFKASVKGAEPGQVRDEVGGDSHHLVLCNRRSDDSARLILNDRAAGTGCAHSDRRDRKSSRGLCAALRCFLIIQWIDYATDNVSIGPLERVMVQNGVATRASESLDAHSPLHTIRCNGMTSSAIDPLLATALWSLVDTLAKGGGRILLRTRSQCGETAPRT